MVINRGFHPSVEDREERMAEATNSNPFRGAFLARVISGDGDSERVKVESGIGEKTTPFAYPFASRSAWVRGQPEASTTMISIIGSDTKDQQAIGYFDPEKSNAADQYRRVAADARSQPLSEISTQILPYRPLLPGEVDMGSLFAQTFFGKRDVHQSRGGLTHWTLSSQKARLDTALFEVRGPNHAIDGTLNDMMVLGTVRRSGITSPLENGQDATPTEPVLATIPGQVNANGNPVFAKEFSVVVNSSGPDGVLIDHRQGNVFTNSGLQAQSTQTLKNLRARFQWFSTEGSPTKTEIDENGNVLFVSSAQATEGVTMAVPSGDIGIKVGGQQTLNSSTGRFSVQSNGDLSLATNNNMKLAARQDLAVKIQGRGQIDITRGIRVKSDGGINIDAKPFSGISLGRADVDKYPVLVGNPEYISTLNNVWGSVTGFAGTAGSYASAAANAWAAVGPLTMLIDPSGVTMGLCLQAAQAAGQLAVESPKTSGAIGQHLPKLGQMPNGFLSGKVVAE